MRDAICSALQRIESDHGIRALYAVEAGSRVWGCASPDSDWDVRFLYTHPPVWYLIAGDGKRADTIEHRDGLLDLAGWDLRKALGLLYKGNPPLLEWLRTEPEHQYRGAADPALLGLAEQAFSPFRAAYHYYHMADGNWRDYLDGDPVWVKKYLYVLRPALAIGWLLERGTFPPVGIEALLEGPTRLPDAVRLEVDALLAEKGAGSELSLGPVRPALHTWLGAMLSFWKPLLVTLPCPTMPRDVLDAYWRDVLWTLYPEEADWR